ncbi:MAG: sulfatase-like hydrolase/transferase [Thermoanaerobaculia bacterium]|nr:sulfatase-like hydrolase/transferase [Thermoanaerobaculia bacterium]
MRELVRRSAPSWALYGFAVVQPLLDLVAANTPFLLYQSADGLDVVLVVLVVSLGGAVAIALAQAAVRRGLGDAIGATVEAATAGLFGGVFLLQILARSGWSAVVVVSLAAAAVPLLAWLVLKERVQLYLRFLALGLPVFVVAFFLHADVRGFFATGSTEVEAPAVADPFPVVCLVFDEFPLFSLLDDRLEIDARAFPGFAELARRATWYRNGTTVWERTEESLSSMLSGRVAAVGVAPTIANYPRNLFTLLSASHELRVIETLTRLAPPDRDYQPERAPRRRRVAQLLADMTIVLLHTVSPEEWRYLLPSIEGTWGNFWQLRLPDDEGVKRLPRQERAPMPADERHRADRFRSFLAAVEPTERPGLYFFHSMLPHTPYYYFPSGKVYKGEPFLTGDPREAWARYPWFNLITLQRHLLQVGFADRLVGELIARLEETGLWDRSLVVVVGDHGSSHWPQGSRRLPAAMPHPEDVLRVPLFVKYPGQVAGEIDDRNARTVDILATVADVAGVAMAGGLDGRSLRHPDGGPPGPKVLRDRFGAALEFSAPFSPDRATVDRKLEAFDWSGGLESLLAIGPYRELMGRPLSELAIERSSALKWRLDQETWLADYDPSWPYVPAELTGTLSLEGAGSLEVHLAAAVNGRIAGFAHSRLSPTGVGLFSALVMEAALAAGTNDVELLVVGGDSAAPRLVARSRDG